MRCGRDEGATEKTKLRVNESIVKSSVEDPVTGETVNNDLAVQTSWGSKGNTVQIFNGPPS